MCENWNGDHKIVDQFHFQIIGIMIHFSEIDGRLYGIEQRTRTLSHRIVARGHR